MKQKLKFPLIFLDANSLEVCLFAKANTAFCQVLSSSNISVNQSDRYVLFTLIYKFKIIAQSVLIRSLSNYFFVEDAVSTVTSARLQTALLNNAHTLPLSSTSNRKLKKTIPEDLVLILVV